MNARRRFHQFQKKVVRPQSQATANHKWNKLTFNPNTKSLSVFLDELNDDAERASGPVGQQMTESLLFANLTSQLKRSINLASLENGPCEQIVAHLERELELSGLETDGELSIPRLQQQQQQL